MSNYYERYKEQILIIVKAIKALDNITQEFKEESKNDENRQYYRNITDYFDYTTLWFDRLTTVLQRVKSHDHSLEDELENYAPLIWAKSYDKKRNKDNELS